MMDLGSLTSLWYTICNARLVVDDADLGSSLPSSVRHRE